MVERDRTWSGAETGNDRADRRVVELDRLELRQDRLLPHFVPEAGAPAPVRARVGVELAVAAVREGPVAPHPASADALDEALEEVDPVGAPRPASARLLAQRPWIVPIPGTTKSDRLAENLGAASLALSADERRQLHDAASAVEIEGDRYPPGLEDRGHDRHLAFRPPGRRQANAVPLTPTRCRFDEG